MHGIVLWRRGMIIPAKEQFEIALKLRPDSLDARVNLGMAFAQLQHPHRSARLIRRRAAPQIRPMRWRSMFSHCAGVRGACRPNQPGHTPELFPACHDRIKKSRGRKPTNPAVFRDICPIISPEPLEVVELSIGRAGRRTRCLP